MQKRWFFGILGAAITLSLVLALVFGLVSPVQAAEIRENGVLNADETIDDDLIISGSQVRIDGTVNGLLIAAGQTITLNGTINGDALLFGQDVIVSEGAVITGNLFTGAQTITVRGQVTGSIAGGAASMVASGPVGRNLYYGGYSLETQAGSIVDRGLYFGGYQTVLKGSIARDLNARAEAVELDGKVGGDARIRVGEPGQRPPTIYYGPFGAQMPAPIPSGLRVGPEATIGGSLVYTSEANQDSAIQAAPAGGIVYQTPVPERQAQPRPAARVIPPLLTWLFSFLRNFMTLLLLGLLAVWLLPVVTRRTSEIARAQPAQSAVYGLVTIIVGYIGAFLAAILIVVLGIILTVVTLGGLSATVFGVGLSGLAAAVTIFTLLVSYVSKLVVSYLIGDFLLAGAAPTLQGRRYWAIVLGVLIYALVRSIPILGWLIGLVVTIIGVGAMWLYYRAQRNPPSGQVPAMTSEGPAGD